MSLSTLTQDERYALAGLAKLIVRADSNLSLGEMAGLSKIAKEMGQSEWKEAVSGAALRFKSRSDVMIFVEKIDNLDAQHAIYQAIVDLAEVEDIDENEQKVIDWLKRTWKV